MSETMPTSELHSISSSYTEQPRRRRRRQPGSRAALPSPPRSKSTPERPTKRRKTHREDEEDSKQPQYRALRTVEFWENLTRIPLAKSALQELDRRNSCTFSPAHLTGHSPPSGNLRCYARHGGPDLCDLRGFEHMSPARGKKSNSGGVKKAKGRAGDKSNSRTTSKGAKRSSPYDAVFKQHLVDNKVWPIGHWLSGGERPPAPDNLHDILGILHESGRNSLQPRSFTLDKFTELHKAYDMATHEEARSRTLDAIEGAIGQHAAYAKQGPVEASNLSPLTPGNLAAGNPDRAYGARPEVLEQVVRRALDKLILPTATKSLLCPNFIVHIKGPNGSPEVAKLQAVYDGALAARGIEALWAFGDEDAGADEDERVSHTARTITCTFVEGILRMYTVHLYHGNGPVRLLQQTPWTLEEVEYSTTLLGTWPIYDDYDSFCKGATAFRNGLEWARAQIDMAVSRANKKAAAKILL